MQRPVLYSFGISSCSWRVRIALAYKGIDHEIKVINLPKGETKQEAFLKINPMGQIPVYIDKGNTLIDSIAIMEYLDETHPHKPLMPKDVFKRAKVRQICEIISSGIQPLQAPHVAKKHSDDPAKQLEWTQFYIIKGFTALERVLAESSGKYCVGDDLSLADLCLIPQVYNAEHRFQVDMTAFPTISRVNKSLLELEPVKSTYPA